MDRIVSMQDIERKHTGHWFSAGAMRSFKSRLAGIGYGNGTGGVFFVSSERFSDRTPRLYTVRYQDSSGDIDTVNTDGTIGTCPAEYAGFQAYRTSASADRAARKWAAAGHVPAREWQYVSGVRDMVRMPVDHTHDGA